VHFSYSLSPPYSSDYLPADVLALFAQGAKARDDCLVPSMAHRCSITEYLLRFERSVAYGLGRRSFNVRPNHTLPTERSKRSKTLVRRRVRSSASVQQLVLLVSGNPPGNAPGCHLSEVWASSDHHSDHHKSLLSALPVHSQANRHTPPTHQRRSTRVPTNNHAKATLTP
jgi:hypothetical protein